MSKLFEDSGKRLSKVIDFEEIKFDFIDQIGSGGFGKVYAGFLNGKKIGIKKITIYDNDPNKNILLKFLEREIYTLKMLSHPNVIQFYGIAEKERSLFLLTELVRGGDLHYYIKNKDIIIPWKLKFKIARDIAASMNYLHSNGVIHRDLKSTNLLVAENWVIKVCDMGLARKMDKSEKSKMTICGTDDWMAPEVLIGEEYDSACDVFSFGMVLIELITRENLSPRIRNEELGIDNVYFYSRIPLDCPKELVRLVNECCRVIPAERPTFYNIHGLLDYLLEEMDLDDDYEPPLRTFKPPELHIPIVNDIYNNTNGNGGNNNNNNDFSFPRPYQPGQSNVNQQQQQQQQQNQESDFSFPRPYQPGQSNVNQKQQDNQQESDFSFPRPYQPDDAHNDDKNGVRDDDDDNKEDDVEEEEMKQLKKQLFSKFPSSSKFSFPRPYQESKIISFDNSEILEFPRPYQPNVNDVKQQPLLENPNFSFPRPYNPEFDSSIKNDPSIEKLKSKIIIPNDSQLPSISNDNNNNNNEPVSKVSTSSTSVVPSSQSRISISTATSSQNQPSNSVFRSTATVQTKSRSMSTPVKPVSSSSVSSSLSSSTTTTTNIANNNFPKSKTPTSTPTNKVVIGNVRENSSKNFNQPQPSNYANRVITINKSNKDLGNTLNNTSNSNLAKINTSSNNLSNSTTTTTTTNNTTNKNNNNVVTKKVEPVKVVVNNKPNPQIHIQKVENKQEENKNLNNNNNIHIDDNSNNKEIDEELNSNGDKVQHRRSRSLDIKSSTKGLIKKFEELTRFNSQQSNINAPISTMTSSKLEGKLHFGGETLTYEKVSPRGSLNNSITSSSSSSSSSPMNVSTNNHNNIQAPTSPKKGFWKPKK